MADAYSARGFHPGVGRSRPGSGRLYARAGELQSDAGGGEIRCRRAQRTAKKRIEHGDRLRSSDQAQSEGRICLYRRGQSKKAKGDLEGAIADFSRAIELNPNAEDPLLARGFAWVSKGDFEAALADFDRAIVLDPVSDRALVKPRLCEERERRFSTARSRMPIAPSKSIHDPISRSGPVAARKN